MTLLETINVLQSINMATIVSDSIEETTDDFIAENKKQLLAGYDSNGDRLLKYQSNKYARVKNEYNPLPGLGNPDLNLTGAFQARIEATLSGTTITELSTDSKGPELEQKYGPQIFGVGGEYKNNYLSESLGPQIKANLTDFTGLKFR